MLKRCIVIGMSVAFIGGTVFGAFYWWSAGYPPDLPAHSQNMKNNLWVFAVATGIFLIVPGAVTGGLATAALWIFRHFRRTVSEASSEAPGEVWPPAPKPPLA